MKVLVPAGFEPGSSVPKSLATEISRSAVPTPDVSVLVGVVSYVSFFP